MDRRTILETTKCDLRRLPLSATEAFFLSQLDRPLALEEATEIAGLDLREAIAIAERLIELGAARVCAAAPNDLRRAARTARPAIREVSATRVDPRAERASVTPEIRAPRRSLTPNKPSKQPPRRSRQSLKLQRPPTPDAMKRKPGVTTPEAPPARKSIKLPAETVVPSAKKSARPPAETVVPSTPKSIKPPAVPSPQKDVKPADAATTTTRARQLRDAAIAAKNQERVDLLVKAADTALAADDVVAAANHLRLALSHREDADLRAQYEALDARSRTVRFEKNIGAAAAAEKDLRWADAAVFLLRAHEARADADVAFRAAHALRLSAGDLALATTLAEAAASADDRNLPRQIELVEIYIATGHLARADAILETLSQLAPKDMRVKALAASVTQRRHLQTTTKNPKFR